MQTVEAPEEDAFEDEEQWLPLQQPQVDERQAQEVLQRAQSVPDEELGAYPGMRYGAQAGERPDMGGTQRYAAIHTEGPGAAEVERRRAAQHQRQRRAFLLPNLAPLANRLSCQRRAKHQRQADLNRKTPV